MVYDAALVVLGSGMVAGGLAVGVVSALGRWGRLPRQTWIGVPTREPLRSDEAWRRAHRAAAPHLAVAGLASAGFGAVVVADALIASTTAAGVGSAVLGAVALVASLAEATSRADREARQTVD